MAKKHKIKTEIQVSVDEAKLTRTETITDYLFIKTHERVPVDGIIASLEELRSRNAKAKVLIYEESNDVLCFESSYSKSRKLTSDEMVALRKEQAIRKVEDEKSAMRAAANWALLAKVRAKGTPKLALEEQHD